MNKDKIKFIDLFAGIGGFRLGFDQAGGYSCVFSSDNDSHAAEMYKLNYGDSSLGDITSTDSSDIPDFNVLLGGFPCQSFSISGKQQGFKDSLRGTLFFDIVRILEEKNPEVFVLENVANLEKHDNGNTFRIMMDSLHELGYTVNYKILNGKDYGVPQNRSRIIIVGNRLGKVFDFEKVKETKISSMEDFLDKEGNFEILNPEDYTLLEEKMLKRQPSGLIFRGYLNNKGRFNGIRPNTDHLSRVHRQPNRIYSTKGVHPTIPSQETSGRFWIHTSTGIVRKLTLDECYRFQGFPEDFKKTGSLGQLYARIGNSIVVPMVKEIAIQVREQFFSENKEDIEMSQTPKDYLNQIYNEAIVKKDNYGLTNKQQENIKMIVSREENFKGVFTVVFSSLVYKSLHPEQDVRNHQAGLENGYSGRTFDTKIVTPFLNEKRFLGAMKESGWLTRSLEQAHPYNLEYPGKIRNEKLRLSFLAIFEDIENKNVDPEDYLKFLIKESFDERKKKEVVLINPIDKDSNYIIKDIVEMITSHFDFKYQNAGASVLPEICIYSIYECLIVQLKRFSGKVLTELGSHTSADLRSKDIGDISVKDGVDFFEAVEIKYKKPITYEDVYSAYNKIKPTKVQRYYLLSTENINKEDEDKINKLIREVEKEHGCQIIVNGLVASLNYYLRLLDDTDEFMDNYLENLSKNSEVKAEQKLAWNEIVKNH